MILYDSERVQTRKAAYGGIIGRLCFFVPALGRCFWRSGARKFTHPGICIRHAISSVCAARLRKGISCLRVVRPSEKPIIATLGLITSHSAPFEVIARDGEFRHTKSKMEQDFSAAYQNALLWALTGTDTHAAKSLEILLSYMPVLSRAFPHQRRAPAHQASRAGR